MIAAVIMAGGKSRRMGGQDKAFISLNGKSILAHVIHRLSYQTKNIVLNSNKDPELFKNFDIDIIPDTVDNFPGPLAGILAGMEWFIRPNRNIRWILSVPVDSPFFPYDLIDKLYFSLKNSNKLIAVAKSNERIHPVFALWNISLLEPIKSAINNDIRKIDLFTEPYDPIIVEFNSTIDPFFNINTPEDLKVAEKYLKIL